MSSNFTPWERVQISRSAERPTSLDYISTIFERYMSLHGDRYFGDDKAIKYQSTNPFHHDRRRRKRWSLSNGYW